MIEYGHRKTETDKEKEIDKQKIEMPLMEIDKDMESDRQRKR